MSTQKNRAQGRSVPEKTPCLPEKSKGLSPRRAFRYHLLRLLRLQGNPFSLARGIATGIFVALTPTIPFHTILTVIFCAIGRSNVVAGVIASLLISNPVTIPFQYLIAWKLGTILTGSSLTWEQVKDLMNIIHHSGILDAAKLIYMQGFKLIGSLLLGGVAFALPCAIIAYFSFLYFYRQRQKRRMNRILKDRPNDLEPSREMSNNQ
ncbi:MAG: DUF2062 domain-containing protein [Nitrospiraceae bacterium]|nr:DUF2062 domain-containing protein [Nitrospiraceae bacterium]